MATEEKTRCANLGVRMRRLSCLSSPPLITGELPSLTWTLCWPTSTCCSETSLTGPLTLDQSLQALPPLTLPNALPRKHLRNIFLFQESHQNKSLVFTLTVPQDRGLQRLVLVQIRLPELCVHSLILN